MKESRAHFESFNKECFITSCDNSKLVKKCLNNVEMVNNKLVMMLKK
jgi:hypothetical protein